MKLPKDVVVLILRYIDSVITASLVCKYTRDDPIISTNRKKQKRYLSMKRLCNQIQHANYADDRWHLQITDHTISRVLYYEQDVIPYEFDSKNAAIRIGKCVIYMDENFDICICKYNTNELFYKICGIEYITSNEDQCFFLRKIFTLNIKVH